eukprot:COSAG01_NODE_22951_length_834_cov_10.140136_1_plen_183_part_10
MSKKNSKAMRHKRYQHALQKEATDAQKRKVVRERKAINRVRRASSIALESQRAQMAAAAAAVPEATEESSAPIALQAHMPRPSPPEAARTAPRKLPKPKRGLQPSVPGGSLLMATFGADCGTNSAARSSATMHMDLVQPFVRERRLSKSEMASLRFDAVTMLRGPSKAIRKRKGPKAQQQVLN